MSYMHATMVLSLQKLDMKHVVMKNIASIQFDVKKNGFIVQWSVFSSSHEKLINIYFSLILSSQTFVSSNILQSTYVQMMQVLETIKHYADTEIPH